MEANKAVQLPEVHDGMGGCDIGVYVSCGVLVHVSAVGVNGRGCFLGNSNALFMILSKAKPKEPTPKEGDRKVTTHFAWRPKKVKEGVIFLERYERHWLYMTRLRVHMIGYFMITPTLPAWDIIEEKRINACA